MKKKERNCLDTIQIASPCPANWDEMEGDDKSRFCKLCSLNVYNISSLTSEDAEQFLQERMFSGERVCVSLYRRPDGTVITEDCPVGLRKLRAAARRVKSVAAAIVALTISALTGVRAQQPGKDAPVPTRGEPTVAVPPQKDRERFMGDIATPITPGCAMPRPSGSDLVDPTNAKTNLPYTLNVRGTLFPAADPWYTRHCSSTSLALKAISSATINGTSNQKELEKALELFTCNLWAKQADTPEVVARHHIQTSLRLTGEANCLYYLGKAMEAATKYEEALRELESVKFDSKPAMVTRIFGNLNQAERLLKEKFDAAALKERLGKIAAAFSEKKTNKSGIAWITAPDGACDFTEPLL